MANTFRAEALLAMINNNIGIFERPEDMLTDWFVWLVELRKLALVEPNSTAAGATQLKEDIVSLYRR